MRHPRLDPRVPVLSRPGGVQVGLDPDHGVVLGGDDTRLRALLTLMDGTMAPTQLALASGLPHERVADICAALTTRGLLAPVRPRCPRVRLIGSGALARDIATAIATTGLGRLVVVDPNPPPPHVYAHACGTGGESLAADLRGRGHQVEVDPHWLDGASRADVTVIADDHAEPDRAVTSVLARDGHPHLLVRPLARGVIVGPLVLPGRTACVRCTDLVRSRDTDWVAVLAQLANVRLPSPATVRLWAVGQVLVSLRALAEGGCPPTAGTTLELGRDWTVATREWPIHPACGCTEMLAAA